MQNKQKILYIVTIPDWGGAQKYTADLAYENSNKNFKIIVATGKSVFNSKMNLLEKCKRLNVEIHQFKNLTRKINPIKDVLALWEIKKYIEKEAPDYIHLNSSKAAIIGSFAVKLAKHRPRVWYTVHGWVFLEPMANWRKKLYIFLERWASRERDKIIVLGEREKQIAIKYKICPESKLQIKHHTLFQKSFFHREIAKKNLNLPQEKKIIGAIANHYPAKGLNYLIEAAAQINNSNIIFAVIGDGPERNNIKFQILNFKLENRVLLLGEKENAAQYLKAFDLFILPSIKEGAPYTILEAMEAKLPIIATEVGSVPEMLKDYQNKIIVPPADIKLLIQAILSRI